MSISFTMLISCAAAADDLHNHQRSYPVTGRFYLHTSQITSIRQPVTVNCLCDVSKDRFLRVCLFFIQSDSIKVRKIPMFLNKYHYFA